MIASLLVLAGGVSCAEDTFSVVLLDLHGDPVLGASVALDLPDGDRMEQNLIITQPDLPRTPTYPAAPRPCPHHP